MWLLPLRVTELVLPVIPGAPNGHFLSKAFTGLEIATNTVTNVTKNRVLMTT